MAKTIATKTVEAFKHDEATRKYIPTAEYQSVPRKAEQNPVRVAYERRNRDLDPQLVWRGKDEQDWSDLDVHAPPLLYPGESSLEPVMNPSNASRSRSQWAQRASGHPVSQHFVNVNKMVGPDSLDS